MGPCQYDLVSLLKDSYVRLDDAFRNEMIEHFIQQKEKEETRAVDRQEFIRIFEWMSIQRNLKAVGTFAYQSVVKKKHRYLEYIPQTLDYVRQTLSAQSDLSGLKQILTQYIPGLVAKNTQGKYDFKTLRIKNISFLLSGVGHRLCRGFSDRRFF